MSENECPHCGFDGIQVAEKSRTSFGSPLVCEKCGGSSYVKTPWFELPMIFLMSTLAPALALSLFAYFWIVVPGVVVVLALYACFWKRNKRRGKLIPTSEEPKVPSRTLIIGMIIVCSVLALIVVKIVVTLYGPE